MPVVSIGMDENTIYWTNGSAINSVTRADPNSTLSVSNAFRDESVVVSIHSLSPGQQPQYCKHYNIMYMYICILCVNVHNVYAQIY